MKWLAVSVGAVSLLAGALLGRTADGVGTGSSLSLAKRPNIVFILTDDQDLHLDSLQAQDRLKRLVIEQGTTLSNHWATIALCCPSRVSMLRGQAAHNTNITHVGGPGGNFWKWVLSGEDKDYLPHWLVKAGYQAEYIGKLMNGMQVPLYNITPKGWTHVDVLLDLYTYEYNNVVMSADGEKPLAYPGWHQTDVIRAKSVDRIEHLADGGDPFFLEIAPTSPHVEVRPGDYPIAPARYYDDFADAKCPRSPNWNQPDDKLQRSKPSWLASLPRLNDTEVAYGDVFYRRRLQALKGVDDIVEDVVDALERKGILDNTYIIYSSDNGFHVGNHRVLGGKALPYREDTHLPMFVRGPGIPRNATSAVPETHTDLAPTLLDIAGLPEDEWPPFLDGRSLLADWKDPGRALSAEEANRREIINVEFWGGTGMEAPGRPSPNKPHNSYKSLRVVTPDASWLYSRWCTGDAELYNTTADPYEIRNLVGSDDPVLRRWESRLGALLMVTKSCSEETCRDPWSVLRGKDGKPVATSLAEAMRPEHDDFFATIPQVAFRECMNYQATWNEAPYFPPESAALGSEYRQSTDNFDPPGDRDVRVPYNAKMEGDEAQRHARLDEIARSARPLNAYELYLTNDTSGATPGPTHPPQAKPPGPLPADLRRGMM